MDEFLNVQTLRSPEVEIAATPSISGCKRDGAGSPLLSMGGSSASGSSVKSRHGTPEPSSCVGTGMGVKMDSPSCGVGVAGGSPKLANLLTPPETSNNAFPSAELMVARYGATKR